MKYPYYALDFGTTNSSIALCESKTRHRLLEIDPGTKIPHTVRSLFCIEKSGATSIGEEAIKRYTHAVATIPLDVKQKMKLALSVDDGGFVKTANFRDALAEYKGFDVPARLFQSPKMLLRYIGAATAVFGQKYTVQDVAYGFLKEVKNKADAIAGKKIDRLFCSRPIRFAEEDFQEKYATKNLADVLRRLGFSEVKYAFEPVAAAEGFIRGLTKSERILVFDCGGGTTDISVIEAGAGQKKILANIGVPKAGNNFNEDIFYNRFARELGQGTTYGRKELLISDSFFQSVSHWLPQFETSREKVLEILYDILKTAQSPEKIQKLIITIEKSLNWEMFEEIETKKKILSRIDEVTLDYNNWGVDIHSSLTRPALEAYIRSTVRELLAGIDTALRSAKLNASDIDHVLRVGGSSLVPLVSHSLEKKFGKNKIVSQAIFTDVINGLMLQD